MVNQDQKFVKDVLLYQIRSVEAGLLSVYPNNGLKDQLETGIRYYGYGTAEAFFSYHPNAELCKESIDLIFSLVWYQQKAIFCSENSWSDDKTMDEVVVCHICSDCLDELEEKVEKVVERTHAPLVDRMIVLLENFCQD